MAQAGTLFSALHAIADEITTEKQAAATATREKRGEPTPSDPGGYQGASTHPSTSIDNRGQKASEGARSAENKSDVKEDQKAPGVDNTAEATTGSAKQDDVQLNIGTQQSATGEDASVEDRYKGTKDDPGSSHPATTEDGEKYGSASFDDAKAISDRLSNEILADLANGFGHRLGKQAESSDPLSCPETGASMEPVGGSASGEHVQPGGGGAGTTKKKDDAAEKTASQSPLAGALAKAAEALKGAGATSAPDELAAGYELAAMLGIDKQAAAAGVAECLDNTIRDALLDGELLGSYLSTFAKQAADEGDEGAGEDHGNPGDDGSGGGEAGEAAGGGGGGGGEMGSLGDMLGGGGDPGGMMGGGDPGMGGAPGGGVDKEQALMQLVAALDELGVPIEELFGAGGGGMPPEAGGAPPMGGGDPAAAMGGGGPPPPEAGGAPGGAPPMTEGMKLASAAKAFKRSGKYRFKEAANGTMERALRDEMKAHILEVLG